VRAEGDRMMTTEQNVEQLRQRFGDAVHVPSMFRGEISVAVSRDKVVEICRFLKSECGFDMLSDLCGVDNYGEHPRFAVVYHLYSMANRCRLRVKVNIPEDDMTVDSVTSVWATANWHEREAFDMFGIRFTGHPELKRILMWDGYPYFPMRKDFPLAGMDAELRDPESGAGRVAAAPMEGGPFVSTPGAASARQREPQAADTAAELFDKKGAC
jgi:NADH-quinone oxidoreductase subunit C